MSLLVCVSLSACVDDSYDMSKDIDMTVGIGSEGLQLKLGSTERILLKDILEVEEDENINTTEAGLYYLVEKGRTDFSFDIPQVAIDIDDTDLVPVAKVIDYAKVATALGVWETGKLNVPSGLGVTADVVEASSDMSLRVDGISADVRTIKDVSLADGRFRLSLEIEQGKGTDFVISHVKNLKLHFPDYIKVAGAVDGILSLADCDPGTYKVDLGMVNIEKVCFAEKMGKDIVDGRLDVKDAVALEGDFGFKSRTSFSMGVDDYANLRLTISANGGNGGDLVVSDVTGQFDPAINPSVDPINVGEALPDFLKDEEVRIKVSNPTIKFGVDMSQVPVGMDMSGKLTATGGNVSPSAVYLPENAAAGDKVELRANHRATLYFHQGETPFDPDGVEQGGELYKVGNISDLITVIPDYINVDMSDGKVSVRQGVLHTVSLGHEYNAAVDYSVYVPFNFDRGLKIVYNDSIDGMNDDLEDYEADGVTITANVLNTVPLDLVAKIVPADINGQPIPGITVNDATIAAARDGQETETPIELRVVLANRSDLRLLDKFRFRIEALSVDSDMLTSEQYIHVNDIRLKLDGQVTADFN